MFEKEVERLKYGTLSRQSIAKGLLEEIRYQLRNNPKVKGDPNWKSKKLPKSYVVRARFPMFVEDMRETGRSEKYHAERVEELTAKYDLGVNLWSDDLSPPDEESFEGTELTDKEREFIAYFLNAHDENAVTKKLKSFNSIKKQENKYNSKRELKRNKKSLTY